MKGLAEVSSNLSLCSQDYGYTSRPHCTAAIHKLSQRARFLMGLFNCYFSYFDNCILVYEDYEF